MQSLGLGDGNRFVVYDNSPLHSAARAWWMLRIFGAHHVAILDGGLQKWKAEGRPLESGASPTATAISRPCSTPARWSTRRRCSACSARRRDRRRRGRRRASPARTREPRPGIASGHIPGSRNLPQSAFFNADNSWKRGDELRAVFDAAGVDLARPMVTTCGSGVTACVLLFGAHLLGKEDVRLYDGSWSEWGADPATPKATGAAA